MGNGGDGSGNGDGGGGGGGGNEGHNPVFDLAENAEGEEEEEDDDEEYEDGDEEEGEDDEEGEEAADEKGETAEGVDGAAAGEEGDDDNEDYTDLSKGTFFCADVKANGLPVGPGVPTEEELFAGLNCQPGFVCSRSELSQDLRTLLQSGLFANVDARVQHKGKGKYTLEFTFSENLWQPIKSFKVAPAANSKKGSLLIPEDEVARVMKEVAVQPGPTGLQKLAGIKNIVEGWYQKRGFVFGYISHYEGMETGDIVARVVEGRVNKVNVVQVDDEGNPKKGAGEVQPEIILREMPFKPGQLYNAEDGRKALRDVFALGLFDNVQIFPRPNPKDEAKVDVDIMVKERPMKTADLEAEWQIAPGNNGKPALASIVPGGSLTFEHRNIARRGRQATASITAQNFLAPADDLGYKVEYRHPYFFSSKDPKRTALAVSIFNARKLSGVFTPGPNGEDVPPVFIDRAGAKVGLIEQHSRNSKASLSVVMEQVTARDDSGQICSHATRQLPTGMLAADGPPTTLSPTGVDRLAFLQANLTRDATYFVNGSPVGARDMFVVEQGLGIGSGKPFFNRHTASMTRFLKLRDPPASSSAPPTMLVLHARAGNALGDMASYDYFTLGGPFSVRGYNVGELAACRSFLEGAVELRVPVLGKHVYGFYEYGTDLGSSKLVKGNPTEYYRRAGSGASLGGGIKLGAVRLEYATDANAGQGNFFVRFGERF
ncbi:Protein TOC75, chloroplastic [Coccomyxa sp. Obi]|nr:Protein TOC75, chloroplastic [Coccomyxa sp. Obi]